MPVRYYRHLIATNKVQRKMILPHSPPLATNLNKTSRSASWTSRLFNTRLCYKNWTMSSTHCSENQTNLKRKLSKKRLRISWPIRNCSKAKKTVLSWATRMSSVRCRWVTSAARLTFLRVLSRLVMKQAQRLDVVTQWTVQVMALSLSISKERLLFLGSRPYKTSYVCSRTTRLSCANRTMP